MKRRRGLSAACLLLAVLLGACSRPDAPAASQPTSAPFAPAIIRPSRPAMPVSRRPAAPRSAPFSEAEWREQAAAWLRQDPCAAPCWEGVTPGATTVAEALAQLRQSPLIDPATVKVYETTSSPDSRVDHAIQWEWVGQRPAGFPAGGQAAIWAPRPEPTPEPTLDPKLPPGPPTFRDSISETREITPDTQLLARPIERIEPDFGYYNPKPSAPMRSRAPVFTLGEVSAAYGEPDYAVATFDGRDSWRIRFAYEQAGFVLDSNSRSPILLDDTLVIDLIEFSIDPIDAALLLSPPEALIPWQGMRDFAFYCRLEKTGAPCP